VVTQHMGGRLMSELTFPVLLEHWRSLVNGTAWWRECPPDQLTERMAAAGGYLVDSGSGGWLRLGRLRELTMEWLKPEDSQAAAWLARTRCPGLLTPERFDRYAGSAEPEAADLERALSEALPQKGAALPASGYAYWSLSVRSGAELEAAFSLGEEPGNPLEYRAWQIAHDHIAWDDFIRLLRNRGPSGDRMHDLERDALFDYFAEFGDQPTRHSSTAAIVYRALKAATYQRAGLYLDRVIPGERQHALQADLRMGDSNFQVQTFVHPLVAALLAVENHWSHELSGARAVEVPLIGRRAVPGMAAGPGGSPAQLAALFELAYDDIEPRRSRVWAPLEAGAGHLVADGLFELLRSDDEAAEQLAGAAVLRPAPARTVTGTAPRLVVVEPSAAGPARPAPAGRPAATKADRAEERRRQDQIVSMLRDKVEAPLGSGSSRWVQQFDFVHEATAALQTGAGLAQSEVNKLGADLASHVVYDIERAAHDPNGLVRHVGILSMLGIVLSGAKEVDLDRLYRPALRHLRALSEQDGLTFTLLPTLERSITIAHSKDNNFRKAEDQLLHAFGYLDYVLRTTPPDDEDAYINAREAAQQIALQAAGMYMRLTELYLAEPILLRDLAPEEQWAVLREACWLGFKSSAYAYAELKYIDKTFTLPEKKVIKRSATKRWHINTRCMHMRGLLLQAMLEAVEVDRYPEHLRPKLEKERVRIFVDAVPEVYREATSVDVGFTSWGSSSPAMVNELTRSAMHYAFMSRMRPLQPGKSPTPLPPHLAGSTPRQGADGVTYRDFDLDSATRQLLKYSNDAGILACISVPEVAAVLERRSVPKDMLRETWGSIETSRGTSPYRQWVRRDQELRRLLSRPLTAEMARQVGTDFSARRRQVRSFLQRHEWL
jgi:hypothetical protein